MAEIPDTIVLQRDRDLVGRGWEVWLRRSFFSLLPLLSVLALFNVFGIRPSTSAAEAPAARLEVYAPSPTAATSTRRASVSTHAKTWRTRSSCSIRAGSKA